MNVPAGICPTIIPRLKATAMNAYCGLVHCQCGLPAAFGSRRNGASTASVCRSSRLIVIDADSRPTMVQRFASEDLADGVERLGTSAAGRRVRGCHARGSPCQLALTSVHCRVFDEVSIASSACWVTSASSKFG